ncbi:MAG: hypothetical protein QXL10_06235 [Candidatus Bathyarchaeia archaeon]
MSETKVESTSVTEADVIAKVSELMETIDQIKKYGVLSRNIKRFTLIVGFSIVLSILVNLLIPFLGLLDALDPVQRFFATFPLVLIPATGVLIGILYIRRKIDGVKTSEWKEELAGGFPSALRILSEINWDSAFDVVTSGRSGYAMYSLVKGAACGFISFFALGFTFNFITYIVLQRIGALGYASFHFSLLITFLYLKRDLSRRLNEIREIDRLYWELRRFTHELRNTEL